MKYIASWSGGKDSTASIILAHENNEPLDLIIFSEVMFDKNISGELPEHIDFIKNKCIPLFESWGYKTNILHSEKTYLDSFHHIATKGKRIGRKLGFPMSGKCVINRDCKIKQIKDFFKTVDYEYTQYIGIAVDEPMRLDRVVRTANQTSLLQKYGYTEKMAFELCEKYGLLSPIYRISNRGGCWFCPNAKDRELKHLRNNHRELWGKLLELENVPDLIGYKWNMLAKTSIHDKEEQFFWEDNQINLFDYARSLETTI